MLYDNYTEYIYLCAYKRSEFNSTCLDCIYILTGIIKRILNLSLSDIVRFQKYETNYM